MYIDIDYIYVSLWNPHIWLYQPLPCRYRFSRPWRPQSASPISGEIITEQLRRGVEERAELEQELELELLGCGSSH